MANRPRRSSWHPSRTGRRAFLIPAVALLLLPAAFACAEPSAREGSPAIAGEGGAQADVTTSFDGERALRDAGWMVDLGPRPLGSEALERTRVYIEEQLREAGLEPVRQEFTADTPIGEVAMANIVADVPAAAGAGELPTLLLGGHYDTKLYDDFEFVGANDGASSAAWLLEAGRVLAAEPAPLPVRLVFFDGEEAVARWGPTDGTYGSRHMVRRLAEDGDLREIGALILVDMVGDADLRFPREGNSTLWLVELLWGTAESIGHGEHFGDELQYLEDDHVPFLRAGVDAIDLIDFSYGPANRYWHSPFDTIDRLSAGSLQVVGETVLAALPAIADRLAGR